MLKVGVLGCGRIGQIHSQNIQRLSSLFAVSDALPESANRLAQQLGVKAMTADELIASPEVDAIVIATPTDTHFDVIHKAAAEDKALFCEKPIDLSVSRINDCLEVIGKHKVPFFVGFNRRFDPGFQRLKAQIDDGVVGDTELVTILSRDPSPPSADYVKSSGGLFRDMMIHDFDMARFLLGEEPVELFAAGSCLIDPEIGELGDVDTAVVTLKTQSGKICQISNSRRATYGYDQRIEVHGSKGLIRAENTLENQIEVANDQGFHRAVAQRFFLERYAAAYFNEMQYFLNSIDQGLPLNPSGYDGLRAQILADAASDSRLDGQLKTISDESAEA